MDPVWELQTAIYARLSQNAALTTLIGVDKVYDNPPADPNGNILPMIAPIALMRLTLLSRLIAGRLCQARNRFGKSLTPSPRRLDDGSRRSQ
jgi:hypothetical protein